MAGLPDLHSPRSTAAPLAAPVLPVRGAPGQGQRQPNRSTLPVQGAPGVEKRSVCLTGENRPATNRATRTRPATAIGPSLPDSASSGNTLWTMRTPVSPTVHIESGGPIIDDTQLEHWGRSHGQYRKLKVVEKRVIPPRAAHPPAHQLAHHPKSLVYRIQQAPGYLYGQ